LKASGPDCGARWRELSVRFNRDSSSWKTHRCLFIEVLPWSSVTLPRWGTMRSGELSELTTQALHTSGTASGFWPTPTCDAATERTTKYAQGGTSLSLAVKTWPTPTASDNRDRGNLGSPAIQRRVKKGKQIMLSMSVSDTSGALNPQWVEWLMGWPLGWTDCDALATDRFQPWSRLHGID
jgi:hypothetical protein